MDMTSIIAIVTVVVSLVLGLLAKKSSWVSNNLIPVQNLAIGIIAAAINFAITKDFNMSIAASGLMAGGTYDLIKNLIAIRDKKEVEPLPEQEPQEEIIEE